METYKFITWDCEANGLLEDATEIWCISYKHSTNSKVVTLSGQDLNPHKVYEVLAHPNLPIIGHNIIGYDIPMIKKFFGIDLVKELGRSKIIDTLIMSQCLHPDRQLPIGCPTSIKNPVTGLSKKITEHSLETWGYRTGRKKIEIHDWRTFTPDIISRCEEDVLITQDTYISLLKEARLYEEK
jgi:hypothetical protein